MSRRDPRVDAYVAKAAPFAKPILIHLRKVIHTGCPEVQETIKWQFPHFDYKGIMCSMAAFKEHCAFGFWKAALILDGDKLAQREAMGHFGCIKSLSDLPGDKTLIGYVRKAAELNEKGIKVLGRTKPTKKAAVKIPDYFTAALKRNTEARKTFEQFSPSNRREYVDWVSEAKRDETRKKRLATSIRWLAEGKPRNWKYMPARK